MSNLIPPLVSDSPPPLVCQSFDEEDDYGNSATVDEFAFDCDREPSLPSSPQRSSKAPPAFEEAPPVLRDVVRAPLEDVDCGTISNDSGNGTKSEPSSSSDDSSSSSHCVADSDDKPLDLCDDVEEDGPEEVRPELGKELEEENELADEAESIVANCDRGPPAGPAPAILARRGSCDPEDDDDIKGDHAGGGDAAAEAGILSRDDGANDRFECDFGAFSSSPHQPTPPPSGEDDDFGDFAAPPQVVANDDDDDGDDDFGDFAAATAAPQPALSTASLCSSYTTTTSTSTTTTSSTTTSSEASNCLNVPPECVAEMAEKLVKQAFPEAHLEVDEFQARDLLAGDEVFEKLKDIEKTPALSFQWAKSESQELFLKSINIDSRNILYGPNWNPSMPRFAANLGTTPLEPIKTELQPKPAEKPPETAASSASNASEALPSAQFDWMHSGLVNPLDLAQSNSLLLDSASHLDLPQIQKVSSSSDTSPVDSESWDSWLQTLAKSAESTDSPSTEEKLIEKIQALQKAQKKQPDVDSVKSLELTSAAEQPAEAEVEAEDDFGGFKASPAPAAVAPSTASWTVPLRETHISSGDALDDLLAPPAWRKETEVTPAAAHEEDDFSEFHQAPAAESGAVMPAPILEPAVVSKQRTVAQINWPEPGIVDADILALEMLSIEKLKALEKVDLAQAVKPVQIGNIIPKQEKTVAPKPNQSSAKGEEDDDWSDFVSIQTNPHLAATAPLPGPPQPLRQQHPQQHPQHITSIPLISHLSYQRPSSQKNGTLADDDWSDFVSAQKVKSTKPSFVGGLPRPPQFTQWNANVTPNIITNPVSFDSFHNYSPPSSSATSTSSSSSGSGSGANNVGGVFGNRGAKLPKKQPIHVKNNSRSAIPTISSMPELDFISPKSQGFSKK